MVLSALANSELPFSQVLSALSQDQDGLEESSVFQTAFNVELSESAAASPVGRIAVSLPSDPLEALNCIVVGEVSVPDHLQYKAEQVSSHRPCRTHCGGRDLAHRFTSEWGASFALHLSRPACSEDLESPCEGDLSQEAHTTGRWALFASRE